MKIPLQMLSLALATMSSITNATPVPKLSAKDKIIRVGLRRWGQPSCAGEGPTELIPKKNLLHNRCMTFPSELQQTNEFVSYVATWTKHWEHDYMFMYGRCRIKAYSEINCAGTVLSAIENEHWDGACHDMTLGKAASMSLYCDYNKPIAPQTRYWDV